MQSRDVVTTIVVIVVLVLLFGFVGGGMMGFGMGPGMMGWYGGFGGIGGLGGFGMIFGMLFWVGLLALVIWGIGNWASLGSPARHTESALDVLKRRYASGDISRAEFEAARKDLA